MSRSQALSSFCILFFLLGCLSSDAFAADKKKKKSNFDFWRGKWEITSPAEMAGAYIEFGKGNTYTIYTTPFVFSSTKTLVTSGRSRGFRAKKSLNLPYKFEENEATANAILALGTKGLSKIELTAEPHEEFTGPIAARLVDGRVARIISQLKKRGRKPLKAGDTAKFRVSWINKGPGPIGDSARLTVSFSGEGITHSSGRVVKSKNILGECKGANNRAFFPSCTPLFLRPGRTKAFIDVELDLPEEIAGRELRVYIHVYKTLVSNNAAYDVVSRDKSKVFRVRGKKKEIDSCTHFNTETIVTIENNTDTILQVERIHRTDPLRPITAESDFFQVDPVSVKSETLPAKFGRNTLKISPFCGDSPILVNSIPLESSLTISEPVPEGNSTCVIERKFEIFDSSFGVTGPLLCDGGIKPGLPLQIVCPGSVTIERTGDIRGLVRKDITGPDFDGHVTEDCRYESGNVGVTNSGFRFIYTTLGTFYEENGFPYTGCKESEYAHSRNSSTRQFMVQPSSFLSEEERISIGDDLVARYENAGASCP